MNLSNATIYQKSNDPESPRAGVSFSRALLPLGRLPENRADPERPECVEVSLRLGSAPSPASVDTKNSCHKKYHYLLEQR